MAKQRATKTKPQQGASGTQIRLRVFDGRREPVSLSRKYFVRILDGNQQQYFAQTFKGPGQVFAVKSFDNWGDRYTVLG